MSRADGGQAFPVPLAADSLGGVLQGYDGMTLRDYFAAHASDEDIACAMYDLSESGGLNGCTSAFARRIVARYAVADSMLAERAKP